jgi:type III pantothenate kinase
VSSLLVDIGNTRIKWARLAGESPGRGRAAVNEGWGAADYARHVFSSARGIERVLVASVAGGRVDRALGTAARGAGLACEFVRVPRRGGGVTVGYAEPWRLGVDRFVALVGAHALFEAEPLCVVGAGTALTIDLIGSDGRHRGGVIVPAPALMVDALLTRTHGIRRRARGGGLGGAGFYARSTRDGIVRGSRYAAAALVDRSVEEASEVVGRRPLVVLTGGGAGELRTLVRSPSIGVPDLVLRGLAVLAREALP